MGRITFTTDLTALADREIVIEAIRETIEDKSALMAQLDGIVSPTTIIATNTSSIPVAQIAAASQWTARRAKAIVSLIADGETGETDETARWLIEAVEGEDFREGRDAFLGKRKPAFPFR
jgi:3-hydroxyacyl-CoA dehydrogenase